MTLSFFHSVGGASCWINRSNPNIRRGGKDVLRFRVTAGGKQLDSTRAARRNSAKSMSSKPKPIGIIGAPFSKGQVSL